ncbi:MAG: hypothetical protein IH621_18170 [Krumholzibacteria bacterium]|nr:hypothetical protein [Candidatus Krumholzibacteria bacterium]
MKNCQRLLPICALVLGVLALAGAARDVSAQNILENPGFETGDLTGWLVFGESPNSSAVVQVGDNGPSAPGTHNAFLDNRAEAVGLVLKQSTIPGTAAGGDVEYSFDLKLDQADAGGVVFAQVFAEAEGLGIVGGSGLLGPLWAWQWTTYAGSFTAPANTNFLTIQITATTGATTGSTCVLHVDNVSLEQPGVIPAETTTWSALNALYR